MNREQRNILLDILGVKLSPSELKKLVYQVLGAGSYDDLGGEISSHSDICIAFLEEVERRGEMSALLEQIARDRLDIDLTVLGISSPPVPLEERPPEPLRIPFIPFANRKVEWEKVVLYPRAQYYLFDAPAGYGKTALLKKLKREFDDRGWFCVYISSEEQPTFPQIAARLSEDLEMAPPIYADDARRTGIEIGKAIAEKRKQEPGVAILFDIDHALRDAFLPVLTTLVKEFIPGVWDGLSVNSEFFRITSRSFRVVLSGRYLATKLRDDIRLLPQYYITYLPPFKYQVVRDICTRYVAEGIMHESERDEFAAHLLFYSGGHPACIARILQFFERSGYPPYDFFSFHKQRIEEIVYEEANWVKWSIDPRWRKTFDTLCVYRRFDHLLLKQLLAAGSIRLSLVEDEYDLATKLQESKLLDWTGESRRHLSDDITRRMLVIHLRSDSPDDFKEVCNQARKFCLDRLHSFDGFSHFWAREVLFEYLQANVGNIGDSESRIAIRQRFFNVELPGVLTSLIAGRDPRDQYKSFKRILEDDWELEFVVNYYLRGRTYDNSVYRDMLNRVDNFFSPVYSQGIS